MQIDRYLAKKAYKTWWIVFCFSYLRKIYFSISLLKAKILPQDATYHRLSGKYSFFLQSNMRNRNSTEAIVNRGGVTRPSTATWNDRKQTKDSGKNFSMSFICYLVKDKSYIFEKNLCIWYSFDFLYIVPFNDFEELFHNSSLENF